jgi:type II secretory pathway pseudopilin PulG
MKTSVRIIIIGIVFGLISFGTEAKKDSKAITAQKQKAFETYILDQYTAFTEQEEWKIFVEVVTLYNEAPSKLRNLDKETKQQFNDAITLLSHAMKQSDEEHAKDWLKSLQSTAHNVNFLCTTDWESLTPVQDTEGTIGEPISQLNGF